MGESKGELTGDLPENHVKVDNMDTVFASLKSAIDKKEDQKLFSAISNIIKQYKEDYNKELTDRNKYLVRYIYQNEKKFLEDFIDNEENFSKLKKRIQEKIDEEISENKDGIPLSQALSEISEVVKRALIVVIKERDKNSSTDSRKTSFTKTELSNIAKEVFKNEFVQDAYTTIVDDLNKKYIVKSRQIYINKLQKFKDGISKLQTVVKQLSKSGQTKTGRHGDSGNRNPTETIRKQTRKQNLIDKNLNSGRIELLTHEKAMGRKLSDRILRKFTDIRNKLNKGSKIDGFLKKMLGVGKFIGTVGVCIGKAFGTSLKFVARGIVGTVKGAFKIIGFIKNNVIMKLFGCVGKLFANIVTSPLSKSFFDALFTPAGMFALGYFTAWMWNKLKKFIPDIKTFFGDSGSGLMETVEWITGTITDITDTVTGLVKDITTIAKEFTKGFWGKIKAGLDFVSPFFEYLTPGLLGFLTGSLLTTIIKVRSNPLFKVVKHLHGMPFLVGLGAVLLINAIQNVFASRDKTGTQYVEGAIKDYGKISENRTQENEAAMASLRESDLQKVNSAMIGMDAEVAKIQELNDVLKMLEKTKRGGVEFGSLKNKTNLFNEFPGLFYEVYDSATFGKSEIPGDVKNNISAEQILSLSNQLANRIEKLRILKTALYSSKNVKDIEKLLSQFHFSETTGSSGEIEYVASGVSESLERSLSKGASNIINGEVVGTEHKSGDLGGDVGYDADKIEKRSATYEANRIINTLNGIDLTKMSADEKKEYDELRTAQGGDKSKFDRTYFLTDNIGNDLTAKLTIEDKQSKITNLDKIKTMMNGQDIIRFKKATNGEKDRMIDEFLKKYEERESSRRKVEKENLKKEIEDLERKIKLKRISNSTIGEAIKQISPWVSDFKSGVKTGNSIVKPIL